MDEVLVGLGNRPHSGCFEGMRCCGAASKDCPPQNVNEHTGEELERVEIGIIVDVVSGFGLVEDELGVRMVAKSGEVHGRAHQIAGKLVEPVGVGGIDGGAVVDGEA